MSARLFAHLRRPGRRDRGDDGDTLIEILISVAILGIAAGAMILGLLNTILASSTYRGVATIDTVLRTATSEAATEIQQNPAAFACPSSYQPAFNTPALPSGYTATATLQPFTPTTGVQGCGSFVQANESWALLVSVTVSRASTAAQQTATIVVDNPSAPAVPTGTTPNELVFAGDFQQSNFTGGNAPTETAGTPFTVVVLVEDSGAIVTDDFSIVKLSISSGTLSGCTATEVAGAVTFSNCVLDTAGAYTLTATETSETGVSPATTGTFNVVPGPPSALKFTTSPNSSPPVLPGVPSLPAGVAFPVQPQVAVYDAYGNVVTSDASTVTLSIAVGTGVSGATLSNCTESETAGVVSFSNCRIDKSSNTTTYTLTATDIDGNMTITSAPNDSNSFYIVTGPAYQVAFLTQPVATVAGKPFSTQPKVAVEDAGGNIVTTDTSAVTLNLSPQLSNSQAIPTGAALSGCTPHLASGVTTFTGCQINDAASGYTIYTNDTETVGGNLLVEATSNPFSVALPPSHLVFLVPPSSSGTAGVPFGTQPQVAVEDANGNVVTSDTSAVTLTLSLAGGLICTPGNTVNAQAGVATFAGCQINTAGQFTMTATDGSLGTATAQIAIGAGTPTSLFFVTPPPSSVTAGQSFSPVVAVQDAYGNTVTTDTSSVTLTFSGSGFSCSSNPVAASGGLATFTGCTVTAAGTAYTLTAKDGTLNPAYSQFNVVAGPANQLAFTVQPGSSTDGVAFNPQPAVAVEDQYGNPVLTDSSTVALAIAAGASGSGSLSGSCTQSNETGGVAKFSNCSINKPGMYQLRATDGTLAPATSSQLTVSIGPPAILLFTSGVPTGTLTAGTTFSPSVTVEDAGGVVVNAVYTVTLSVTPGTGVSCSPGGNQVNTLAGVASFSNCHIDIAGTGYTLTASVTVGAGQVQGTSTAFSIAAGNASKIAFSGEPANTQAGNSFSAAVTVTDAYNNPVAGAPVTVSKNSGPGSPSCTLFTVNTNANGVASFSCTITTAGTYTLLAHDGGLTATSTSFNITAGSPKTVSFTAEPPATVMAGANFTTTVQVLDQYGNPVPNSAVALTKNPGSGSGTLTCNSPLTDATGSATFTCSISAQGTYKLLGTDGAATAVSTSINVTVILTFFQQPPNTTGAGQNFTVIVQATQSGSNVSGSPVTLAIGTGPGRLSCSTANPVNTNTNGLASFSCDITTAGTYTLQATDGSASVSSNSFTISVGAASQLVFLVSPGPTASGTAFNPSPQVAVEDTYGNVVTTANGNSWRISLSIDGGLSTGTGSMSSCRASPTNGVATFDNCSIYTNFGGTPGSFVLDATEGGVGNQITGQSASFTVGVNSGNQLVFTTSPSPSTGGPPFPTQPVVTLEDSAGNTLNTSGVTVTLSVQSPTGRGYGGLNTCTAVTASGVATFSGCQIATGTSASYILQATATGYTTGTSASFYVNG